MKHLSMFIDILLLSNSVSSKMNINITKRMTIYLNKLLYRFQRLINFSFYYKFDTIKLCSRFF